MTLYLDLWTISPKHHFFKWNKIYWNYWPTIYLSTLYDRFELQILVTIYIIERYLISKIPSMVIWYRFQQDITYRDLFIFHYFRYLNLFQDFMKCYVNVLFYSTCLIIMTILIICSFLLQKIYIWNRLVYYASGVS